MNQTDKALAVWSQQAAMRNAEINQVIQSIRAKHGQLSPRLIAYKLNEDGYKTSRGNYWTKDSVIHVIKQAA